MSGKLRLKGSSLGLEPSAARMLLAAINEHEAELARVARLLHDDISQVLSAVGLQLDVLRMDFRDEAPGIDERATEIQKMLEQTIAQLRDLSNELNPSIVERAGLHFALDQLVGKVRMSFPGTLRLHFEPAILVPTAIAMALYKIAECALDNAAARAGCSLIEIQLKRSRGEFVLEIHDNGDCAAASDSEAQPLGWMLMEHYASNSHLVLTTNSSPGKGTTVRASHPFTAAVPEGNS